MHTKTIYYETDRNDRDVLGHIAKAECEIMLASRILRKLGGDDLLKELKLDKAYGILEALVPVSYYFV